MRAAMPDSRTKEKGAAAPFSVRFYRAALLEAAGRVRQHGVHLAGIRGEVRARRRLAALILRDLIQQPLELRDIAVDRHFELAIGPVAVADLVERLLALHRVKPAREYVAFAALVAVPQLGRRVVIDHAGDIDR